MNGDANGVRPEIVIIRRKSGGGDDGHHGGAWKIAYADFVTAMMAFFLVMWLINASNEATRAQVASYFNPIKLTDSSTSKRGLTDPKETLKKKQDPADGETAPAAEDKPSEMVMSQEDKLLHDPMKVLDSLAAKDKPAHKDERPAEAVPEAIAVPTGKVFDPFDPQSWQAAAPPPEPVKEESKSDGGQTAGSAEDPKAGITPEPVKPVAEKPKVQDSKAKEPETEAKKQDETAKEKPPEQAKPGRPDEATIAAAQVIRAQIMAKLGSGTQQLPANLDVTPTVEGVLISLTDKHEFGMFSVGSAEPDPKLVTLVGAIAQVLKERPGFVVVRGHTDSRPYKNKKYDNWQLSSARAQMAVYMLERGGLDQSRVKRIEGYADRDPRDPNNPEAAVNRRIDILIGGLVP